MGNRILKKLLDVDNQKTTKTFYTRDAQGNVLSIYENGKQKVYQDSNGNKYYFNDRNELIKMLDQDNVEQDILTITGKLIFTNGQPVICINTIKTTSCKNKLQIKRIGDNIYVDRYGNKYLFNGQNQLIEIGYGGMQQFISEITGQALITENGKYFICIDEQPKCENREQIKPIGENIYQDQYGNEYYFKNQRLVGVKNGSSVIVVSEVTGQLLIIEDDKFYICLGEQPKCTNREEIYRKSENFYRDQYGNIYGFNEQNQLIEIMNEGYPQLISQISGQVLIIEKDRFYICLDEQPKCKDRKKLVKIDRYYIISQNRYQDQYGNIYEFDNQNKLVNITNSSGISISSQLIGQRLFFENGEYFICNGNEVDVNNCDRTIALTDITDENLITQTEVPIYGSDRIGTYNPPSETNINSDIYILNRSYKRYELKDHLGNVRVTVSDSKRVAFVSETLVFSADIKTYTDYYAFGMEMVGRNWSESEEYRFGHNGQEKSKEVGEGNYTAEFWEYDSQTARRFNLDPKPNPAISDYATFALNPIWFSDMKGDTTRVFGLDGKYLGTLCTGSVNEAHFIDESLYKDIKNGHFPNSRDTKKPHKAQEDCVRAYSVAYLGKNSMADIIKMKNDKKNFKTNGEGKIEEVEAIFTAVPGLDREIRFKQFYTEGATNKSVDAEPLRKYLAKYMLIAAREKLCFTNPFGWGHLHPSSDKDVPHLRGNTQHLFHLGTPTEINGAPDYNCVIPDIVYVPPTYNAKGYYTQPCFKQTAAFIGTRFGITVYGTKEPQMGGLSYSASGIEPVKKTKEQSYIPITFFK